MRIGIDARPFAKSYQSGIGVYLENMLRSLPADALDPANGHHFFLYAQKGFAFRPLSPNVVVRASDSRMPGTLWMQAALPGVLKKDRIDVFWGCQHVLPLKKPRGMKYVLTVHDLVFQRFPETMQTANLWMNRALVAGSLKKADAIVADSRNTLQDLREYYPGLRKPVEIVYPGVNVPDGIIDRTQARSFVRRKFGVSSPFILIVGTHEPRKNFVTAYKAFSKAAQDVPHTLVSAGKLGWKMKNIFGEIRASRLSERITFLDYVENGDLPFLYRAADVFLFPSLYEGFGLPPLEAMSYGCPVIASNAASLPEVVGKAGILLPPEDADLWARTISNLLRDESQRASLESAGIAQARTFSWKAAARSLWGIFRTAGNRE